MDGAWGLSIVRSPLCQLQEVVEGLIFFTSKNSDIGLMPILPTFIAVLWLR